MAESKSIIKFLNGNDVQAYMAEVVKNENLFILIRESFQLKFDHTRGLLKSEISDYIESLSDRNLRSAMKDIKLLGESRANITIDQKTGAYFQKAFIAYIQRKDGKYDILVAYATQTKDLDYQKVVACGVGSLALGVMAGFVTMNPWVGVSVAAITSTASVTKGACDYCTPMPDVLCGFMLQELATRQILTILPSKDVQLAIC